VISEIKIRYFDGCPSWKVAEARLREVLRTSRTDEDVNIVLERVESDENARALRFAGSPTILLDGVDPFATGQTVFGLACRVYRTEAGLEGSPSEDQLRRALLGSEAEGAQVGDEVSAEGQRDPEAIRAVRNAAFRSLFDTGAPVSLREIAVATNLSEGDARDAIRALEARGRTQLDPLDRIITCGGLSVESTRHRIETGDVTRWTMCAYDALGILGALGGGGRVVSASPLDEARIEIGFAEGSPTTDDAVLFYADGYEACESVYEQWCPMVNLFPNREDAERWADSHQVTGRVRSLADATRSAAAEWCPLFAS
jgi:hypothetical protein